MRNHTKSPDVFLKCFLINVPCFSVTSSVCDMRRMFSCCKQQGAQGVVFHVWLKTSSKIIFTLTTGAIVIVIEETTYPFGMKSVLFFQRSLVLLFPEQREKRTVECPVPCRRVLYKPNLSYALLSAQNMERVIYPYFWEKNTLGVYFGFCCSEVW